VASSQSPILSIKSVRNASQEGGDFTVLVFAMRFN
jgi:hypothetical protein